MEKTKAPSGLQGHVEGFSPVGWTLLGQDSVGNPRQAADLHGFPGVYEGRLGRRAESM